MKSKFLLLLKMQIYGFAGINHIFHSKNLKEKQNSMIIGIGIFSIIVLLTIYSTLTSLELAKMNMCQILPSITVFMCSMITLFFTFLKGTGVLTGTRNYDIILSLPVKSQSIIMSQLTMTYFTNFVTSLIVVLPAVIIYGIYMRPTIPGYIIFLLSLFLIPIIPMIFALGIGLLIMATTSHFRHKNIVSLILSIIVVLVIVFGGLQYSDISVSQMADISLALSKLTVCMYPPAAMVSIAVINDNWALFLLFAGLSVVIGAAFISVVSHFYKRLNTWAFSQHPQADYTLDILKVNTPLMALYKRELRQYFSCTIYVLNSSIGMIFLLVMAIIFQFISPGALEAQTGLSGLKETLINVLPLLQTIFIGMSCTTSASLSLEGKNRWIMCSVPVRAIDIFHSKIALNLTVILPFAFLSSLLLLRKMHSTLESLLLLFLVSVVYALFISIFGMFLNVKFPMYDWKSEYYAVKGASISVLVTSVTGLLSGILPLWLCIALPSFCHFIMGGTLGIMVLLTLAVYRKLYTYHLYINE